MVYMPFRVFCQNVIAPHSPVQFGHDGCSFAIRMLISASSDKLLVIVEPGYVKLSCTTSNVTLLMWIDGGITKFCPMTCLFDADGQTKFIAGVGESIH